MTDRISRFFAPLSGVLRLVGLCAVALSMAGPAVTRAQSYTVGVERAPSLGTIVRGTANTSFTVSSTGSISSDISGSTAAVRLTTSSVSSLRLQFSCAANGSSYCNNRTITFTLTEGTGSGASIGRFYCTDGQGTTADADTSYTCGTSGTGTTATQIITVRNTKTSGWSSYTWSILIPLGVTVEVPSTATRGNATVNLTCSSGTSLSSNNCSSGSDITAKIIRDIQVAKSTDLSFGKIVRPASGSSVISVSTAGARSLTSGAATLVGSNTGLNGTFTITGEGAQAISVTVPSSVTLSSGANTLTMSATNNLPGGTAAQTLGSTLGSDATLSVKVGGAITLASTTAPGAYTGTLRLTAAYQ